MFTRAFRKPVLALAALAASAAVYLTVAVGLYPLSNWAEREVNAHPFKYEDWLRFLEPRRLIAHDEPILMIAGPSSVRENLLLEILQQHNPGWLVHQGGLSLGTIQDTFGALVYLENAYGSEALPDRMILGISPRFVAGIPDWRPARRAWNDYNVRFNIDFVDHTVQLRDKTTPEALEAALRYFLRKEPVRLRTGVHAAALALLERQPLLRGAVETVWPTAMETLDYWISPYRYRFEEVHDEDEVVQYLTDPSSFWYHVFRWNPSEDRDAEAWLRAFVGYTREKDIELLIVNMPEKSLARDLYQTDYDAYLALVRRAIGDTPFVDLRNFLSDDEIADAEHATLEGAQRLTLHVIRLVERADIQS